jgi:hypothetical protein
MNFPVVTLPPPSSVLVAFRFDPEHQRAWYYTADGRTYAAKCDAEADALVNLPYQHLRRVFRVDHDLTEKEAHQMFEELSRQS